MGKMMSKLPRPNERGHYKLQCGSIIYPSGGPFDRVDKNGTITGHVNMPNAGKFLLWVKATESFAIGKDGLVYFDTPQDAMKHLMQKRDQP